MLEVEARHLMPETARRKRKETLNIDMTGLFENDRGVLQSRGWVLYKKSGKGNATTFLYHISDQKSEEAPDPGFLGVTRSKQLQSRKLWESGLWQARLVWLISTCLCIYSLSMTYRIDHYCCRISKLCIKQWSSVAHHHVIDYRR